MGQSCDRVLTVTVVNNSDNSNDDNNERKNDTNTDGDDYISVQSPQLSDGSMRINTTTTSSPLFTVAIQIPSTTSTAITTTTLCANAVMSLTDEGITATGFNNSRNNNNNHHHNDNHSNNIVNNNHDSSSSYCCHEHLPPPYNSSNHFLIFVRFNITLITW